MLCADDRQQSSRHFLNIYTIRYDMIRCDTIRYDTLFYVELNKVFCMNNKSIHDGMAIQIRYRLRQVSIKTKK